MFKHVIVVLAAIACAAAKPSLLHAPYAAAPLAFAAPAPIITATSSQVVARTHNGIAAAPIVAAAPVAAPLAAAPLAAPIAPISPLVRYAAAPFPASIAPVARYATAPLARYAAAPLAYTSPLTAPAPLAYARSYAAPLHYAAAPALW
ncbi:cuticle protein 16.5-like [Bactrocera oleae]|uniref:cuticle protein 16.5-like n=1 Tax=Bactrocera oleae TaxID=104688 RepID=UPI00387EA470